MDSDSEHEARNMLSLKKLNVVLDRRLRNCSYAGVMDGFWKKKVSIGVQFLFASQKDDSDRERRGTVRMMEQLLDFG